MHIAVMFKLGGRRLAPPLLLLAALLLALLTAGAQKLASRLPGEGPARVAAAAPGVAAPATQPRAPARRIAGPYRAEAIRIIDGDTFEARLRIWFNQDVTVLVRLDSVDAPELRGRCDHEKRLAEEAREALTAILASGEVFVSDLHTDKYNGRAVGRARVLHRGGAHEDDVAELLKAGGYARPYGGRGRGSWCAHDADQLAGGARPG